MAHDIIAWATIATLGFSTLGCCALGLFVLAPARSITEARTIHVVRATQMASFLASMVMAVVWVGNGAKPQFIRGFAWYRAADYDFSLSLVADALSVSTTVLTTSIVGLVSRFSRNYLHKESGHYRFFALLALFTTGMLAITLAGSIDVLFAGWELVGTSSALLIGFFRERIQPVAHGLRAFVTYRVCDLGLLLGAVLLHHYSHRADWAGALSPMQWPLGVSHLGSTPALAIALLFLLGAMGKSAQFPLSGWLPRAMEGPTPSSALFYGALSIHAGVILLLRVYPLLNEAPLSRYVIGVVGLCTAAIAAGSGRVQSDVKNRVGFATLAQVGLMFVEIALGWPRLAMIHLFANALLRTWQMLRAPSALQDTERTHQALGGAQQDEPPRGIEGFLPTTLQRRVYALALSRFHMDALLDKLVVRPVMALAQALARVERRVNGWQEPR